MPLLFAILGFCTLRYQMAPGMKGLQLQDHLESGHNVKMLLHICAQNLVDCASAAETSSLRGD